MGCGWLAFHTEELPGGFIVVTFAEIAVPAVAIIVVVVFAAVAFAVVVGKGPLCKIGYRHDY